jgi:hypothetical protein
VDFSEAMDLFGIIFQIPWPNCKIMDCGLISKKPNCLSAKCRKLEFPGIVFLKENPWTKSTSSWTASGTGQWWTMDTISEAAHRLQEGAAEGRTRPGDGGEQSAEVALGEVNVADSGTSN